MTQPKWYHTVCEDWTEEEFGWGELIVYDSYTLGDTTVWCVREDDYDTEPWLLLQKGDTWTTSYGSPVAIKVV